MSRSGLKRSFAVGVAGFAVAAGAAFMSPGTASADIIDTVCVYQGKFVPCKAESETAAKCALGPLCLVLGSS